MIADPRDIILRPIVSEKSYGLLETGSYTFEVHPDANKTQVKIAIEQIFDGVKVDLGEHDEPAGQAQAHPQPATASASRPSAPSSRCPRTASRSTSSRGA